MKTLNGATLTRAPSPATPRSTLSHIRDEVQAGVSRRCFFGRARAFPRRAARGHVLRDARGRIDHGVADRFEQPGDGADELAVDVALGLRELGPWNKRGVCPLVVVTRPSPPA